MRRYLALTTCCDAFHAWKEKGGDIVPLPDKIESLEDLEELEGREEEFEGDIIPLDEDLAKALIKALEERR